MPVAEIKLRRGTTVDWLLADPVLSAGEPGYDLDTHRLKIGDGTTPWSGLLFQTVDPGTLTRMLTEVDAAVATAEAAADTAADAAASVQREQVNGVAGLDAFGLLFPQRIPPSVTPDLESHTSVVTTKERTGGVAKLTFATTPLMPVGTTVTVRLNDPGDTSFDGSQVVTTITGTTVSYTNAGPDLAPVAAAPGGYVVSQPTARQPVGKGELVFRVTDPQFGAVPDGVFNSTAAVNAAGVAAANAGVSGAAFGRGVVEFPYTPEGYACNSLIALQSGVTYRGDRHVRVRRVSGTPGNYLFDASTKTDITIEGFTLDGNGTITNGTVLYGTRSTIRDNVFIDSGIQLAACYPINAQSATTLVEDVLIENNRLIGMRNNIHVKGNTRRCTIRGNDIGFWSSVAIAVDGDATTRSTELLITGNRVHDLDADSRAVTTKQIAGNVATLTLATDPDPGWVVGFTLWVDIGDANYDGGRTLTAVDVSAKTISFAKTAANSGPTSTTGYVANGNRQPISVQSAQSGVAGAPGESSYHEHVTITENHVVGNYVNHQATANGGTADCISLHHTRGFVVADNIIEGSGDCGIVASYRSHRGAITGNTVVGASGVGIAIGSATGIFVKTLAITGNTVLNCGQGNWSGTSAWASAAVNLRVLTGAIVEGNMLGDDQAVPTQRYGITVGDSVGSSSDIHLGPNQYFGNIDNKRLTPAGNARLTFVDMPVTLVKTSDTGSNLDGTARNDPHLFFTPETNSVYEIEGVLGYNTNGVGAATPGVKIGFAAFAGASIVLSHDSSGPTATSSAATSTTNSNRAFQTSFLSIMAAAGVTGATPARIMFKIRLTVGPAAGVFQLTLAQNAVDAVNAATLVTGSYMTYKRVA